MIKKYDYILIFLVWLVGGCISDYNSTLPSDRGEVLIVDGNIIENTDATFYLSKSFPLSAPGIPEESLDIVGRLTIFGSDGYQSEPAAYLGKGVYQIHIGELNDDVAYGIQIEYEGNTYCSALSQPLYTPEIDSVSWVQPERWGNVSLRVSTHGGESESEYYIWNYDEDWETKSYYKTIYFYDPATQTFYEDLSAPKEYCWKKTHNNKIILGTTETLTRNVIINKRLIDISAGDDRFTELYSIKVVQQSISKKAYEYYRNKIKLNEEMGGLFTPQPSELAGNIICQTDPSKKVMGYISVAKNITDKRIFIPSFAISKLAPVEPCPVLRRADVAKIMEERGISTFYEFFNLGFRPIYRGSDIKDNPGLPDSSKELAIWSLGFCTDCEMAGGAKAKPDFWPEDHNHK